MRMNRMIAILFLLLLVGCPQLKAQFQSKEDIKLTPWYFGIKGGMSFGVSTFSSFGADKTREGYNFGSLAGYRINHLFSAEFSAMFGRIELGSSKCCADYWLGVDGVRYVSPVAGVKGNYYRDLYSSVSMQQYGIHLNIDMIQLCSRNDVIRWSLLLSPSIYGVGTCATIKATADKSQLQKVDGQFLFGIGGDVGVGYRITDNLGVRFSSGINCLIGNSYDGIPNGDHGENFVWNNNLSLTWRFGKSKRVKSPRSDIQPITAQVPTEAQVKQQVKQVEVTPIVEKQHLEEVKVEKPIPSKVEKQTVTIQVEQPDTLAPTIVFPTIQYRFNDMEVRLSQQEKLIQIFKILKEHPELHVTIVGYSDGVGTKAANDNISQLRADGVKYRLVKRGIASERIIAIGKGTDTTDPSNARRAEVKPTKEQ